MQCLYVLEWHVSGLWPFAFLHETIKPLNSVIIA